MKINTRKGIENNYLQASNRFAFGIKKVIVDNKIWLVNLNGKKINKQGFDHVSWFGVGDSISKQLVDAKKNGKYGYLDKYGNEVIPFIYDDACHFTKGRAKVKLEGKRLVINKKGKKAV